jgi:hypothetical protein
LTVILLILATWRLTRLITTDTIFEAPRDKAQAWLEYRKEQRTDRATEQWQSKLAYLIGCPYCTSVWVAAVLTLAVWALGGLPLPLLVFGAVAGGAAVLAHLEIVTTRE